ncbi:MAG: putative porin [candidate division Zixibacteria bacterium]|nr:putative porin [candidate division Zixibacteria bacterium]
MKSLVLAAALFAMMATTSNAGDWWENVKVKGDLRYRHEMIDQEGKDVRHRQRVRARLMVLGKVSSTTQVGIQLATGSDDPVSTNQTLDGAFATKTIGLDLAYLEFTPENVAGLSITAGKFKNPFFLPGSSELIWDSDWNPEGGVAAFSHSRDNLSFTATAAGLWVDESSGADSWIGALQGVGRVHFNEKKSSVAVGASYYGYTNSKGHAPFYEADDSKGNSVTVVVDSSGSEPVESLEYANEYKLMELFGEVTHKFDDMPVTVMGDFVTNTDADSLNAGWLVGLKIGSAKKPGSWAFRYNYRNIEKDAVVGAFTDSDFRGGGTDAKGHEVGGSLVVAQNTWFNVSYFVNTIGLDAAESDFNRLQVDLQLKF